MKSAYSSPFLLFFLTFALPLVAATTALLAFTAAAPVRADDPTSLEAAVDAIAGAPIENGKAVGLAVGVAKGGEILLAKGYGLADIENGLPVTADSVFRIGSITKMFTAAAVLQLAEEGKLDLDDPLVRHVPGYPDPGKRITLRHLLQHTSGIFSFTDLPDHRAQMGVVRTHQEILARFRDEPLHFDPGEKFRYCNSGYYLLGMVIESASGTDYEAYLEERIFAPLALGSTFYDRHARIIPHRARGYATWGDKTVNAPFVSMTQPFAAGALASTVGDLVRFQRGLVNHGILSAGSFDAMTTPGRSNDGKPIPYGLGCFVGKRNGLTLVRHGGAIAGFTSELVHAREPDLTVIVLSNSNGGNPRKLADAILEAALGSGK